MRVRHVLLPAAAAAAAVQLIMTSSAASALPSVGGSRAVDFHVMDMHGSVEYGGVKLYSSAEMEVCDDHSDGIYITAGVYDYENGRVTYLADYNGAKSPCYWTYIPYLQTYDELQVTIYESSSIGGVGTEKATEGGLFLRSS